MHVGVLAPNSGVTRGSRGGRPPSGACEKRAKNELNGIYFDIFWGQMVHKGGSKLGFSGNFVSNYGKWPPTFDAVMVDD